MTFEKRKCKICGKEFQPKAHNSVYCSKTHKKTCKYCGEEFECRNDVYYKREACYKEECKKKSHKEGLKKSAERRYEKRKCPICGKEFQPKTENQIYCSTTHKKKCIICGKEFDAPSSYYEETNACSRSCNALLGQKTYFEKTGKYKSFKNKKNREKAQKTFVEKYGTTNINEIPGVKEKREQTNLERYGTKNTLSKGSPIRDKIDKENLEKYGTTSPMGNPETQAKARETIKKKYGVDYPLQDKEIWNKTKDNIIKNNGGLGYASASINKKVRETELKRYGDKYHSRKNIIDYEIWDNLEEFILNNKNLYSATELSNMTGIVYEYIRMRVNDSDLGIYVRDFYTSSQYEGNFEELLKKQKIKYIKNYRRLITPKEVDFYLPDLKIAIEISPTETHCSNQNKIMGNKPKDYHLKKFIDCENKGVRLFTIFDWIDSNNIINLILTESKFLDEYVKTDNALGYTKEYMYNLGYELFKEIPPTKRYKSLRTKEINYTEGDLEIYDCGHRIWKRK